MELSQALADKLVKTGARAIAVKTDIAQSEDCRALVRAAVAELGRLDILVNNAGFGAVGAAAIGGRVSRDHRREPLRDPRVARSSTSRASWRSRRRVARGRPRTPRRPAFSGSRATSRRGWTARRKIRVNAIGPGFFETEMTDGFEDKLGVLIAHIPVGRLGDPDDLPRAVVYLASDASRSS